FYKLTADIERLPFPMAPVAAEGATALAESSAKKETWRWRVFSISAMIGIIFGLFYVVIPTFTGLVMAKPFMLFPIPWVDATSDLGARLPAAIFGWGTDLTWIFVGFLLPFWVVLGTFLGSFLANTVMNPIFYKLGIIRSWRPGMTVIPAKVATTMDIWISVTIGLGIVVALVGIWKVIKTFMKPPAQRKIRKSPAGRGDFPIWLSLAVWLFSTTAYIVICHILVPSFPLWIFIIFGFVLTPLLSFVSARMFGITGVATGISFPMVREGTFILSGYKGAGIWFAPVPYFNHGWVTQRFEELSLTHTRFPSWVKAEFTALGIMLVASFLFWQIIWRMGPIPSSTYPFVQKMWPMSAIFKSLWATATLEGGAKWMLKAISPSYILLSSGVGIVLYSVFAVFRIPVSLFYGLVGGVAIFPHFALPMFVGALLGRYFFARRIGKETWRKYTPIILAGYSCGMGLVGMASIALALIAKTVTSLIF
ncbi:MAG: peptide transporter, partial [Caldiserica bacterium]|nr:peptide transporter [Caldisericota bacterium]